MSIPKLCAISLLLALPIGYPAAAELAGEQPHFLGQTEGDFTIKSFHFREVLGQLKLHYVTLGTPHRNSTGEIDNAVLLLHSTGDDAMEFLELHAERVISHRK